MVEHALQKDSARTTLQIEGNGAVRGGAAYKDAAADRILYVQGSE
jgi:hypothetical protein